MVTPALATNSEEASLGRYLYKSQDLNISLHIGVDGVKDLIAVAGFYSERTIESSGKKSKESATVQVFQPKFTRIPIR
jgi:hypothetical protein